jgi:hypothetical protein
MIDLGVIRPSITRDAGRSCPSPITAQSGPNMMQLTRHNLLLVSARYLGVAVFSRRAAEHGVRRSPVFGV